MFLLVSVLLGILSTGKDRFLDARTLPVELTDGGRFNPQVYYDESGLASEQKQTLTNIMLQFNQIPEDNSLFLFKNLIQQHQNTSIQFLKINSLRGLMILIIVLATGYVTVLLSNR
jgi:hypothetical protein